MGQNIFKNTSPKALKFTPSHLSSFNNNISFSIFLGALSLTMTLGNVLDTQRLTFNVSYHTCTITITGSLRLKWSLCQQVNNTKIVIPNNYNHLQFQRGLPQVCEEPQAGHEVSTTFTQLALPVYAHPLKHLLRPWHRGNQPGREAGPILDTLRRLAYYEHL
jgi:hypothetical protein